MRGLVRACALGVLAVIGCGQDAIRVVAVGDDAGAAPLASAIERFVGAGRTASAFAALVAEADAVRPRLDETAADEVERRLVVLALAPVQAAYAGPAVDPSLAATLVTTVWPFALRGRYAASTVRDDDRRSPALLVQPGEAAEAYLERICDGPLARDCHETVPELRSEVVGALAIGRLSERARSAISNCTTCVDDPASRDAVTRWGELAAVAARTRVRAERDGDPDNWAVAGTAAGAWSAWPLVVLERDGDLLVAGRPVVGADRATAVRALAAATDGRLGLDVPPDAALGRVRLVLADLAAAGVREVELAAREGTYPYVRRAYRLDLTGRARRASGRDLDSVQVWLRDLDGRSEPGQAISPLTDRR